MWRGEINNERIYASQYVNQIDEQNSNLNLYSVNMGPNGMNNLLQFNTEQTMNCFPNEIFPVQVGNSAILAPQIMQQHSFQNNIRPQNHELYGVEYMGHRENISTNIIQPQSQYGAGMNENNGMVYTYGQSELFCNHESVQAMKRKAEEDYSPSYSGAKRRITDKHMAAEMNSLYITNDHNYCSNTATFNPDTTFNPDNDLNMQFSSTSDDMQDYDDDQGKRKELPVFQFVAPLEQMLKRKNDILPPKIIQEICKPCLAMIPWAPPLHNESQITDENQEKENQVGRPVSRSDEMQDDNFIS